MHKPVLLNEMLEYLAPQDGKTYIDTTFGAGGYTRAILNAANCTVIAFERDPTTQPTAQNFQEEFGHRFQFINDKFSNIEKHIQEADGIVGDFGISSMQVDNGDRGFSFQKEATLNMQMGLCEISAFDVVNNFGEKELANLIFENSNETLARKIATMIFHARKKAPIETTLQLAQIIFEAYGKPHRYKIHPATKTFQAIRAFVNNEFAEIKTLMNAFPKILKPQGRFACVTFHEIEDRIAKESFLSLCQKKEKVNKYKINPMSSEQFTILTKKPIAPSDDEVRGNVRSRSAKLRAIIKNY
jgi:16S rRNA (cytosine1402-N4)-methyltransferase